MPDMNIEEPGYEIGYALGREDEDQRYQYRGKTWRADDIYETMTRAEQPARPYEPPMYITALIDGKYQVLKRHEKSGQYMFFCSTGDLVNNALKIARVLNKTDE